VETTFDKFLNSDPKAKEIFDKEYSQLLLVEYDLEKINRRELSLVKNIL
jgi:hypothetical protein